MLPARKIESIERRLVKMMAKNDDMRKRYEPFYKYIKAALDHANEGNDVEALESMSKFNSLMNEYKLNNNI